MPKRSLQRKSTLKLVGKLHGWFSKGKTLVTRQELNLDPKTRDKIPLVSVTYEVPQKPTAISAKDKALWQARNEDS